MNTVTMSSDTENFSDNEDDHQKTHGSQQTHGSNTMTYSNTQYFKSLRYYLTRDALPSESHYRNLLSIGENNVRKFSRPTLDELHENEEKGQLLQGQKHAQIVGKVYHRIFLILKITLPSKRVSTVGIRIYSIIIRTLKLGESKKKDNNNRKEKL